MHELTATLVRQRREPGRALADFVEVARRGIPGYEEARLPVPSRVLVTGGTGCVGSAVLRLLRQHGVRHLASVSRRPAPTERRLRGVTYHRCDVRHGAALQRLLCRERPDLIIHTAGQRQPALAERMVAETISSNVFGTMTVLAAAGAARVPRVVHCSTGKALRFLASDVYAATKKLCEYLLATAAARWGVECSGTRFTHVVDNSVVYHRLVEWARTGAPVRLHDPGISFYAQSAREAAQLLVVAAQPLPCRKPTVAAIGNLGWPHSLLDVALDVIDQAGGASPVHVSGYEQGYEEALYPGTFDPRETSASTPLFNVLEARQAVGGGPLSSAVEYAPLPWHPDERLEHVLGELQSALHRGAADDELRKRLLDASVALLRATFARAPITGLRAVSALAGDGPFDTWEHRLVHRHLKAALEARGQSVTSDVGNEGDGWSRTPNGDAVVYAAADRSAT